MVDFTGGTWRSLIDGSEVGAIPDSEVERWDFDEGSGSTASNSLTSHDFSLSGPDWVSSSDYVGGYALDFSGGDTGETSEEVSILSYTNDFSLEVWMEDRGTENNHIFYQNVDSSDRYALGFQEPEQDIIHAGVFDGSNVLGEREVDLSNYSGLIHIVHTYDSETEAGEIYVNGDEISEASSGVSLPANSTSGLLMGEDPSESGGFDGVLDRPRIFNEVLEKSDIDALYNDHPST